MTKSTLWRVVGESSGSGHGVQHKPPADGILPRPANPRPANFRPANRRPPNDSQQGAHGRQIGNDTHSHIEAHREEILEHISSHRITFIQGETGCGKSTAVPQFILDDATARGRRHSVRVLVTQPRRVAAVSLAQYVAKSRREQVGLDVGYAISRDRASTLTTRLTFVTSGYLLECLARNQNTGLMTHIILDEVHVRSLDQDLLLLLLKLLMADRGSNGRWSSLQKTKLIIMSATMDVHPLQDYFRCLQNADGRENGSPIIVKGRRFPVKIVHIDEISGYLGGLPNALEDLATRFVEISGAGVRALDGNTLPHFAIDLITGIAMQVGQAGDCILVFVATYADICDIQQGFERVKRSRAGAIPGDTAVRLDVMFLHSMLCTKEQEMALAPPVPDTLKVVIATNLAESGLTIPNVRVVLDLGHQLQEDCKLNTLSRVWCSKASASQRAGRAGRLFPGVVIRLYTRETFQNLPEYDRPDIALLNLGSTILRVRGVFRSQFPDVPVHELLQQLLDSPQPEEVKTSMQELRRLGAITKTGSLGSCELTRLGRLGTELGDIHLAQLVLLGVVMGCGVDSVIMAAGISTSDDIFLQPFMTNTDTIDPLNSEHRRISNLRARMHFHGEYASDLLVYCQVYCEWARSSFQSKSIYESKEWIKRNHLRLSSLGYFLLKVKDYACKTISFVASEFGNSMQIELGKLRTLAAIAPSPEKYGRPEPIPIFCDNIALVQMAIAGAFSRNWLLGLPARNIESMADSRDFEKFNMPAHLSFKLSNVLPHLARCELPKLEAALKDLGPVHKVARLCERVVLVQCEAQKEIVPYATSHPVIWDLPYTARLARYMAMCFSQKGDLVLKRKENSPTAEVEELCLGRPSGCRTMKWTIRMGSEERRVQFFRLSLIARGVEVRKDIPFHIAVAVSVLQTPAASVVRASNVTILPQDKLFSVLMLLMFRPSGPDGELQVRILLESDRIYAAKYQGMVLEFAPRFIHMTTLRHLDWLRDRIHGFLAGADHAICNLARDVLNLIVHLETTEYDVPILAPAVGSWLAYPSLVPVRDEKAKVEQSQNELKPRFQQKPTPGPPRTSLDMKSKPGLQQQPPPQCATTMRDTWSCPVLLQSRNDKIQVPLQAYHQEETHLQANHQEAAHREADHQGAAHRQADHQEAAHLNASILSDVQLFERAFEAAELKVNRTELMDWIGGDKSHNRAFFVLLQQLVKSAVSRKEDTKAVLQYVYLRQIGLVNQKQKKEMDGYYFSICNPDLVEGSMPSQGAFEARAAQRVKLQTHRLQAEREVLRGPTPEMNDGDVITRYITVNRQQRESIISTWQYQSFSRKVTVGPVSLSHPGLITVSGKSADVVLALQGIQTMLDSMTSEHWLVDDTYSDSLSEKVCCVFADGRQHDSSNVRREDLLEFLLVRDGQIDMTKEHSSACATSSLFHPRMKGNFETVLKGLGQCKDVQIQARLGRVVFACSRVLKERLPFCEGQAKPLGDLRFYFDRHTIKKKKFDDTITLNEFYSLRACLHLCHPSSVQQYKNYIIVVSDPRARDKTRGGFKFKITDSPDDPSKVHLQGLERKTRLAVADIVRLHAGIIHVDVRLSMQANVEDSNISQAARDYVKRIVRKGSKLQFPPEPYTVRLQRHKNSERFLFDGFMVTLTNVKQLGGGVSRVKYEAEFEALGTQSQLNLQEDAAVPWSELTSKIPLLLEQVQNVCSQMSCIGPSNSATGVAQALLRSWIAERDEFHLRDILTREFLPATSRSAVEDDPDQVSILLCSLIESLYHCDGRILKEGMDIASELQLILLRVIKTMNISLSKSMESRVQWFLSHHKLDPENALEYACLLKCHCCPLDRNWDSVLQPYLMQLMLENQSDVLKKSLSRFSICHEFLDFPHGQLPDAIGRSSIWTTLSALTRLFQRNNVSMFFTLFNVVVRCEETTTPTARLARCHVRDLVSLCDAKATSFIEKCLEWTIVNESSISNRSTHMQNMFYLVDVIKTLDTLIDEQCRFRTLDLLLRLPSSLERKRELEEALLETYDVDEAQFRNRHYQRILQQLGFLHKTHKEELQRRGLDEKRCHDFNFQTWTPGRVRGGDVAGSSLIPGLNERGTRLIGSRGIFIPARDPSGQITAAQIKNDDNPTGKRKYVWLSSKNVFSGGKGPQIGGELPLFCCVPRDSDTSLVALCEGGLKAHVLAALSGLPVIGASGADFPRSKNLLQNYLAMMDAEQIIFFPDAGSQCNDQVTNNYFQTFRLLRDWGYNVRVAWWGQVNKAEHDDIDDYLVKNNCATELPLFSTYHFWHITSLDVREKLQNNFPEYKTPQISHAETATALPLDTFTEEYKNSQISHAETATALQSDTFADDDQIMIVNMTEKISFSDYFHIKIPKEVMKRMPGAPNDYVTPQSVQFFTIEVRMVQPNNPVGVEAAIDWLLQPPGNAKKLMLGLDCEHGLKGELNLIQISSHQRCVMIRLTANLTLPQSSRLATFLRDKKLLKSGAEVHRDALAIYNTLGLMVNGLKNVSPLYTIKNRTIGMLEIFRDLYGWEWTKKKAITRSDWGCATLTLEQIKYGALDAWASRMIALEGRAASDSTVTSLENLPEELLQLFGRAITSYGIIHRTEKTIFETSGNVMESSRSSLKLLQHNFRSRVTSVGSRVELRFNDGQSPAMFQAKTRTGQSVVLAPLRSEGTETKLSSSKTAPPLHININSISSVIVDNSKSTNPQLRRLQDLFFDLLCHPERCPSILSLALKVGKKPEHEEPIIPKQPEFAAPNSVSSTTDISKISTQGKSLNAKEPESDLPKCIMASTSKNRGPRKSKNPNTPESEVPKSTTASTSRNPCQGKVRDPKNPESNAPTCTTVASTSKSLKPDPKGTPVKKTERPAFPREASELKSEKFVKVFAPLNDSQGEALHQILTSPLSATIGPPGTGKTRLITAVAKAWLLARGGREVLVCTAYQNVAARNLAEALIEEQVPGVLLLVSEDYFVDWHETFYEKLAKSVVVSKAKSEIPGALEDWLIKNKMSSVPILICTLGLVGSTAFTTSLMGDKVTAMVIDECSQAAEGSCIYPITCLPDLSSLAVLGDPHQLPPFTGSGPTSGKVLSIFDLVANGCKVKLLREQYRMPPKICNFISSEIYQNELQTSPRRQKKHDWQHPLLWVDVPGLPTKDPGQTSMYNTAEAQAVLQLCQKLTENYTEKGVVVLTLYEEQNRRISELLTGKGLHERVRVHNVDSFQGQQSDIVLISLVAGKHFSAFAADRRRACVMLTRVKHFLCVCGNYDAVRRNPQALLWKSLAEFSSADRVVVALKDVESMLISNPRLAAAASC